jgi:hypothetical protein
MNRLFQQYIQLHHMLLFVYSSLILYRFLELIGNIRPFKRVNKIYIGYVKYLLMVQIIPKVNHHEDSKFIIIRWVLLISQMKGHSNGFIQYF